MRVFGGIEGGSVETPHERRTLNPAEARRERGFLTLMNDVIRGAELRKRGEKRAVNRKKRKQGKKVEVSSASAPESPGPFIPRDVVRTYQRSAREQWKVPPLASYPFSFIQGVLSPSEQRKLLKSVPSEEAMAQERFDLVHAKFADASGTERKYFMLKLKAGKYPALSKDFEKTFETFLADGRLRIAEELLGVREALLGSSAVPQALRLQLDAAKQNTTTALIPEKDLFRERGGAPIHLPDMLVRFYADEQVRSALSTLTATPDFASRAPTALKMKLAMLNESISHETKETIWRLKRYALFAVQSELTSQSKDGLSCYGEELRVFSVAADMEDLMAYLEPQGAREMFAGLFAEKEDVLNFLSAARARFISGYKNKSAHGGKSWAKIADVAYDIWKEDDQKKLVPLIDRLVQLEHNMGSVLDKDRKEFDHLDGLKTVLDAKFKAKDVAELFDATKGVVGQEARAFLGKRADTVGSLLQMASTYFPTEAAEAKARLNMPKL
ncbi:MAG: hypothetical protein V4437_01735 [Patescibacteria group bacterium]